MTNDPTTAGPLGEAGARLRALVAKWRKEADGIDADSDFCCALTRRNDGHDLEVLLDALLAAPVVSPPQESLLHPVSQVYFRAGLIACREYMARFVEAQDPAIANSIRANWWPSLGADHGPPRQLAFQELTSGEYGTPEFRCLTAEEVSPTQEALPIAFHFLTAAAVVTQEGEEPCP